MKFVQLVLAACFLFSFSSAFAQEGGSQPQGSAVSIFVGPLLPKNVGAVDEILNTVGFRYSMESAPTRYYELGFTISNSEQSEYRNIDLSLRGDIPIQDLTAFFLAGPDLTKFKSTYYGGFHVGSGLLTHLSGQSFFRVEMRFNFHPGTSLLFTFGFELHF